jgi:hypothetical protein
VDRWIHRKESQTKPVAFVRKRDPIGDEERPKLRRHSCSASKVERIINCIGVCPVGGSISRYSSIGSSSPVPVLSLQEIIKAADHGDPSAGSGQAKTKSKCVAYNDDDEKKMMECRNYPLFIFRVTCTNEAETHVRYTAKNKISSSTHRPARICTTSLVVQIRAGECSEPNSPPKGLILIYLPWETIGR